MKYFDDKTKLYALVFEDEFSLSRAVEEIARCGGYTVRRFDAAEAGKDELDELFLSYPMLGERTLALFDNYPAAAKDSARERYLTGLLSDVPEHVAAAVCCVVNERRFYVPAAVTKLKKELPSLCLISEEAKTGRAAAVEVQAMAKALGCTCTDEAAGRIAELTGGDLRRAENEVAKLAALGGYKTIGKDEVERLASRTPEDDVYAMLSATERGDRKKALAILDDLLSQKTEPVVISATLATAFINLYRSKLLRKAGMPESEMFSMFDYKKGDRKVSIAFTNSGRYTVEQLCEVIEILYGLDKGLKSSPVDNTQLLRAAVLRVLCAISTNTQRGNR